MLREAMVKGKQINIGAKAHIVAAADMSDTKVSFCL